MMMMAFLSIPRMVARTGTWDVSSSEITTIYYLSMLRKYWALKFFFANYVNLLEESIKSFTISKISNNKAMQANVRP